MIITNTDILPQDSEDPTTSPNPPKGYRPTTAVQRSDWNAFLDYMGKQKDIDTQKDPNAGITMLSAYRKQNPNFSITPEMLPNIQYEQQQFRKGDAFSTLTPAQLEAARTGMSPNFINQTDPYKSYYPQFKVGSQDFGTDVEAYSKFKSAQPAGPAKKVQSTTVLQGATQVPRPSYDNLPEGTTPRPNYDDPKSRIAYLQTLAKQPGNSFIHGRGDTILHIDDVPDGGIKTAKQTAIDSAQKVGLDPAILYSSAMEEGANGLFPDEKGKINAGEGTSDKYPISGFANYGLDNFHNNFKAMVAKGYLPKDFDYEKSPHTNEQNQPVVSANFKTPDDAMMAKAAYMKMEQDNLEDWAKTKGGGVQLSPTAKQFFTMISFNGGPGRAHQLINYYKSKGLLQGDKFLTVKPDKSVDPADSYGNVLPRLQMANLLRKEKYFN